MNRLTVRGKYIYEGERKFFARGVSYGPFAPNSCGERYPEPVRTASDFALMRELGVNLVRTYVPPPDWMFELAAKHELRMMVGMPWPFHMAFLDSKEMMRDIRQAITEGVRTMKPFAEMIFAYSLGNEIRSDIVRWHGPRAVNQFLRELYDLGKQNDPAGLFTYSNYPSTEYLDVNFLDLVSFNVYLHRETDFRRYLTHLLATTADRPLVLSETGMDTIREGEEHQAKLLRWQACATFELGLAGFIVFAFTDEWHTGGAEITDWAFGLVTRERQPKRAYYALTQVFKGALPPPLPALLKASVVVCAYNAAVTLNSCLTSLKDLNYPTYEVIVVDDGSRDQTATIAKEAGVRLVAIEHRGLATARNAGIAAAEGRIVAFIDADAEADPDWLYHLAETIIRRCVVAAGGQNFPPPNGTVLAAALAAAPGAPREVRAGDDSLDQVCGCSMALDKTKLPKPAPFDPMYTTAGDDVDFSWNMREHGLELAYAPGAVVIHRQRATIRAYLRQQIGYGRAEAALARKYPDQVRRLGGVYGEGRGVIARWLGTGTRVYYGAFGRGLFQSLYRSSFPPLLQIPLSFSWVTCSIIFLLAGFLSSSLLIVGLVGLAVTIASAGAMAATAPLSCQSRAAARVLLAILCILGPFVRSFPRQLRWQWLRDEPSRRRLQWNGNIALAPADDVTELTAALRGALLERGVTVALTDGYQPYDLQMRTNYCHADINLLNGGNGPTVVGWKLGVSKGCIASFVGAGALALLGLGGLAFDRFAPVLVCLVVVMAALVMNLFWEARRIPALIELAVDDVAAGRSRLQLAAANETR
jgi:glycosyltransferase involved in cell wall biosynthesis